MAIQYHTHVGSKIPLDEFDDEDFVTKQYVDTNAAGNGGPGGRYVHEQTTDADSWTIMHHLGFAYVAAQVVRDTGVTMWPDITYLTNDSCRLDFAHAVSGTAILRR